jgi:hypothetical protein
MCDLDKKAHVNHNGPSHIRPINRLRIGIDPVEDVEIGGLHTIVTARDEFYKLQIRRREHLVDFRPDVLAVVLLTFKTWGEQLLSDVALLEERDYQ